MTSRINRQQDTWPQPSKTKGCNKYYIVLQEACSTFSQKPAGRENEQANGVSPCSPLSLWSKLFFFPEVCYYRPSSWVPIQSGACSYKPWGFEASLDWLGGFHQGINTGSHWITTSRLSAANLCWMGLPVEVVVVVVRTSFLALEYGSVRSWMCTPWSFKPWILLIFLYSLHYFCIILFQHVFPNGDIGNLLILVTLTCPLSIIYVK